MFYAQFVLSKKGPLAKIWLAAHWEKKLTKAHVFETNIDKAVESILEPKVKMALRTTGHLLLGIVRIYSRKAKYLLADCNEAFLKIKMAFRPGAVDLPEEGREANLNAITLPEVFHDFDSALPDFSDIDYQHQLTQNQSRIEDITMKEDLPRRSLMFQEDDQFGDGGFDSTQFEREMMSVSHGHHSINLGPIDHLSRSGDFNIDAPLIDDEFGGELDPNLLGIGDGDLNINLLGDDLAANYDELGAVLEETETELAEGLARKEPIVGLAAAPGLNVNTTEHTTLIHNEDEAFALEPTDATAATGIEKGGRGKRRRKLIVDEQKSISGEDMKSQLSDASDTLTTLDLAPPTKKLMHWKETGGVDKLFQLSGIELASKQLQKLFLRNCTTRPKPSLRSKEDMIALEEPEQLRKAASPSGVDPGLSSLGVSAAEANLPTIMEEERQPPSVTTSGGEPFSPWAGAGPDTPYNLNQNDDEQLEAVNRDDAPIKSPGAPRSPRKSTKAHDTTAEDEEEAEEDAAGEPRWTRRTQAFLNVVEKHLRAKDEIGFKDLTSNKIRKQAAQAFYNVLVLRKWEHIEVEQATPFGEIHISKGAAFQPRA